jgi:hypothetical protein
VAVVDAAAADAAGGAPIADEPVFAPAPAGLVPPEPAVAGPAEGPGGGDALPGDADVAALRAEVRSLRALTMGQAERINQLKSDKRMLLQKVNRWKRRALGARGSLKKLRNTPHKLDVVKRGKRRKKTSKRFAISVLGGYTLALKRNAGHSAAAALVQHLEAPITRTPVYKWEKHLASNIICQAQTFYEVNYRCMMETQCGLHPLPETIP